eukprot:2156454-Heterocapsa_arctica.AAC.1
MPPPIAGPLPPASSYHQLRRQGEDAAGHWPARAGASRPPHISPDLWRTLSAALRRELAAEEA